MVVRFVYNFTMLRQNSSKLIRSGNQFRLLRNVSKPAPPVKMARSIGTQTEPMLDYEPAMPIPTTNAQDSAKAAFQDLLGVTKSTVPKDDLENTFYQRELPSSLVRFASPEGKKLFREAMDESHAEGFFPLTGNFTTQSEPAYCGPSSCK